MQYKRVLPAFCCPWKEPDLWREFGLSAAVDAEPMTPQLGDVFVCGCCHRFFQYVGEREYRKLNWFDILKLSHSPLRSEMRKVWKEVEWSKIK